MPAAAAAQQLSSPAARRTPSSATSAIPRHFNPGFAAQTSMPAAEHPDDHVALNGGAPPLDITHFRPEKGGDPELIRESQRRRFAVDKLEHIDGDSEEEKRKKQEEMKVSQAAAVALVDTVVELDTKWRTGRSCVWGGGGAACVQHVCLRLALAAAVPDLCSYQGRRKISVLGPTQYLIFSVRPSHPQPSTTWRCLRKIYA
jgi:hypothetical protein